MDPNSALSAWQLTIMAVVPVMALAAWLIAIFRAARDSGGHELAAAATPMESADAGKDAESLSAGSLSAGSLAGARVPEQPPADTAAA